MDWDFDQIFEKAKVFAQRAHSFERDDPQFPLWCTFSLELLARAVVAKVHPALLADPADSENVLAVFGLAQVVNAKSIPVKAVCQRRMRIAKTFTAKDVEIAMALMDRRNRELHTGAAAFEDFHTKVWLHDYYRLSKMLVENLGLRLADLLGSEESASAEKMVEVELNKVGHEVKRLVGSAKDGFYRRTEDERKMRWELAEEKTKRLAYFEKCLGSPGRRVKCPACGGHAALTGQVVRSADPKLTEDGIVRSVVVLPTRVACAACNLVLDGHEKLHVVELGGQYSFETAIDPAEWFGLEEPQARSRPEQEYMDE